MAKKCKKGSIIYLAMILILLISVVTYSLCYLQLKINNKILSLNNCVIELRESEEEKYIEDENINNFNEQNYIIYQKKYGFYGENGDEMMRRN